MSTRADSVLSVSSRFIATCACNMAGRRRVLALRNVRWRRELCGLRQWPDVGVEAGKLRQQ